MSGDTAPADEGQDDEKKKKLREDLEADDARQKAFFDSGMRLPTESYEQFKARFPALRSADSSRTAVSEELRRLGIDPEVFYKGTSRPGLSQPSPDDDDAAGAVGNSSQVGRSGSGGYAGLSPGFLLAAQLDKDEDASNVPTRANGTCNGARGEATKDEGPLGADLPADDPRWGDLGWATKKPPPSDENDDGLPKLKATVPPPSDADGDDGLYKILTDADAFARDRPSLRLPGTADDDEIPCVELEDGEAAGRLGRETPKGIGSKLQIDNLTDCDEDDVGMLRLDEVEDSDGEPTAKPGEECSEIEAFTIDPDFDYDNVVLTQKFARPDA